MAGRCQRNGIACPSRNGRSSDVRTMSSLHLVWHRCQLHHDAIAGDRGARGAEGDTASRGLDVGLRIDSRNVLEDFLEAESELPVPAFASEMIRKGIPGYSGFTAQGR